MITAQSSATIIWNEHQRVNGSAAGHPVTGLKVTVFDECQEAVIKRWVIKGVIARGETSSWIGPPGSGKSALLAEIALHCACRKDWRGNRAKDAGGVLVLALERADLWKRRLHGYAVMRELRGVPVAVAGSIIDLMDRHSVETIVATVRNAETRLGVKVGIIIIDTFNKGIAAGGGDEDKARDQNRVAANLALVHTRLDVHIALVGHTGKNEDRGARGSNAHLGDVDIMVQISGEDIKEAKIIKANDQAERVLTRFKLEAVELGTDEDGDQMTTAIVSADVIDETQVRKTNEPSLNANEQTLLRLLREADPKGLPVGDWNVKARAVGIGVRRPATLNNIHEKLKRLGMARESMGTWRAVTLL